MENIINHGSLYLSEECSDVEFVLQNHDQCSVKIPAHRVLLASRSVVFKRMFYGDLREGASVHIADVTAEAFTEFLQWFYLPKVELSIANIEEVLMLVDKYDAVEFWPLCEAFMTQTLNTSTAFAYYALTFADNFSPNLSDDIKTKVEDSLCKNHKLLFDTSADVSMIANILKSDKLLGREIDIFNGMMAWAKASLQHRNKDYTAENINGQLNGLLHMIRFPIMASDEVVQCFEKYPFLLPIEQVHDLITYAGNNDATLTVAKQFNCKLRQYDYTVIEFDTNDTLAMGCYTQGMVKLKWTGQKETRLWVTLEVCTPMSKRCTVAVIRNYQPIFNQTLPLRQSSKYDHKLVSLNDPIELLPKDEVSIEIDMPSSLSSRHGYHLSRSHEQPKNLIFDDQVTYIISAIHVKEAE